MIAAPVARTTTGRAGHHPAGTRHRASARDALIAISIAARAELEATRLVAAGAVGSTDSAGAAARLPAAAATATAATVPSGTAAPAIVAPGLTARHEVDEVVEVALLLRAGRRIFAAHHAHQPNVVGAVADHLERLHQTRQAIFFDPELLLDLGGRERGAWIRGRLRGRTRLGVRRLRGRFAVARFAAARFARLTLLAAGVSSADALASTGASSAGALASTGASSAGCARLGRLCFARSFYAL